MFHYEVSLILFWIENRSILIVEVQKSLNRYLEEVDAPAVPIVMIEFIISRVGKSQFFYFQSVRYTLSLLIVFYEYLILMPDH